MEEIWKDIYFYNINTNELIDYRGIYQVSNLGRVKSLERKVVARNGLYRHTKERILKPSKNKNGYFQLHLDKNCKRKTFRIHVLVAYMFIDNPHKYPFINHKDENPSNNCVDNLEWCTCEYNNNWGTRNKRMAKSLTGKGNPKAKSIIQYDMDMNFIKRWDTLTQASKELEISISDICLCCQGKISYAGNYKWKYEGDVINNDN